MKKITLISDTFRITKTKHLLGLLMFCMMFSGYASESTTYIAPMACDVPDSPTDVAFSSSHPSNTTISYQAPAVAPTGYVIFRSTSNVPPTLTDGTIYTVNHSQVVTSLTSGSDTYFCVYNNTGLSGTAAALTTNTQYYYYVFSRNGTDSDSCIGAPVYSTTALTGNFAPPFAAPTAFVASNVGFEEATLSWTAPPVGGGYATTNYFVEVYTSLVGTNYSNPVVGSPFDVGTNTNYTLLDLTQATTYFVRITANNGVSNSPYLTGAFATTQPGQIGNGITLNNILPATADYNYSYNQQIYTKAQIETNLEPGQTIFTKLKFFYNGGENITNGTPGPVQPAGGNFDDWTIYLGNTTKNSFSNTTDWIPVENMQNHFSGVITFPAVGNWVEITLDTPFEWDGQSNIVVAVDENAPGVIYFQPIYWRSFISGVNTGIYFRNYSVNPDPESETFFINGVLTSTLAQVVFGVSEDFDCEPPTQLEAIPSFTSVELFWTSEGTLFEVEYGLENFTLGDGTSVTGITTTQTTIADLIFDTHYHYYVRQDCGDGNFSPWSGPYLFYTNYCEAHTAQVWASDDITSFTTTGGITNISNNTASTTSPNGYGDFTSMSVSHFEAGEVGFTVTTNETFYAINIWVDWNNNMIFEETEKIYSSLSQGSGPFTGTISVPTGTLPGDYRIRVRGIFGSTNPSPCGLISQGETEDYTFTVLPTPDCFPPLIPVSTNISATSVLLEWQSDGDLFDIEYGPVGFSSGDGIIIPEVENPYVLSGLTAGTTYQYYVRQDCGTDDGVSIWNGPVTFTFGVFEEAIPTMLTTNPQIEGNACPNSFSVEVPDGKYLAGLTVQYRMTSASPAWTSQQRSVLYSPTLEMGEAQIAIHPNPQDFPGFGNYTRVVDFANGQTGTIEFELKAWRTEGGSDCDADLVFVEGGSWIMTAEFEDIPTCPNPPADLGYGNITADSADLVWTSDETGTFQIKWGDVGFNVTTAGTVISNINGFTHTLSGLDSSIPYEYYVRRDCSTDDEEDFGEWVGPVRFNSGHCIPYATQGFYFTTFVTTNALDNITYSYTDTDLSSGYVDKTDMVISQEAGASFNFTSNYVGGGSGLRIWVDWNNDFIFEDTEEVFYLASTSGNKSGIITIPSGTIPGDYRIRVRAQSGATATPPACGLISQGEALDFTLNVACVISIPTGDITQEFTQGQTLSDLDVTGTELVWYTDENLTVELSETEELVHGTTYYVVSTNDYCQSEALAVTVEDICYGFAAPTGDTIQEFTQGQALSDLDVTGTGLVWYADEDLTVELSETEELIHGTTYYVVSTNDYCQSEALAVTAEDICYGFAVPTGNTTQEFTQGQTLSDLDVTGTGLVWYADENLTVELSETEELVHGTTYYVVSTNDYCQSEALAVTAEDICFDFVAPTGNTTQEFTQGQILSDLDVIGTGLVWYADEDLTIVLDESTELVHGTTYYVVSTNVDCQSEALAVTAEQTSSVSDFNSFGFRYYPNPVSESLYLSANAPISDITVINMLGQQVNASANSNNTNVDMSGLPTGNYLIKVIIEGVSKTFKVVKN